MKHCTRCGEEKELKEFRKGKNYPDGLSYECVECARKRNKKYYNNNLEKVRNAAKKYFSSLKGMAKRTIYKENNKHILSEKNKEYYKNNKEKFKKTSREFANKNPEYNRNWRKANPDYSIKYREQTRLRGIRWRKENPEKQKVRSMNRTARIRSAKGTIKAKEWRELCVKYNNTCLCCKATGIKLTLDHVVPVAKGGTNTIENAQPLCINCNSRKGTKTIDYRKEIK